MSLWTEVYFQCNLDFIKLTDNSLENACFLFPNYNFISAFNWSLNPAQIKPIQTHLERRLSEEHTASVQTFGSKQT